MLVGIDVGSDKICTLVGEALPGDGIRVLGIGHAPAVGIRRGEVVHVEDAAGAIAASLERAERVAGVTVESAIVGLTGVHLEGSANRAVIPLGRRPRPITAADVDRVLEAAGTIPLPAGREILHVLPRSYTVDEGGAVVSPVGMEGYRLGTEVHVVTASAASLANLRRCLELAEVGSTTLVMACLAASEATLTPDERELGAFVVDLGASATGLACFRDGALVHSAVIPVGGRHMTNDLAVMLQTPLDSAERIKITHGHVLPELDDDTTEVDVESFGQTERHNASRRFVSEILAARADEIAKLIWAELERAELAGHLPAGAVLVGGGSELSGLARRLCARWSLAVRTGQPGKVIGLADTARSPSHASAVGLLAWRARGVRDAAGLPMAREQPSNGVGRMLGWAKDAFLPRSGARV